MTEFRRWKPVGASRYNPQEAKNPRLGDTPQEPREDTTPSTEQDTTPTREADYSILGAESRRQLLEALGDRAFTASEIRNRSPLSPDNTEYHLSVLMDHGFVGRERGDKRLVSGDYRQVWYYFATEKGRRALEYFGGGMR